MLREEAGVRDEWIFNGGLSAERRAGTRGVVERLEEVDVNDKGRDGHRRTLVLPPVGDVDLRGKLVRKGDRLLDVELLERRWNVGVRQRVVEVAVDVLGLGSEVDGGVGVVLEAEVFARASSGVIFARRGSLLKCLSVCRWVQSN